LKPQQRKDRLDSQYSSDSGDNAVITSRQPFSLFFFFNGLRFQGTSLAGDDMNGTENSQLPSLRQNIVKRFSQRNSKKESQMPSLQQPEKLEIWNIQNAKRKSSTLHVQRLRQSVYRALMTRPFFFSFPWECSN
jgi:hypothetical protein